MEVAANLLMPGVVLMVLLIVLDGVFSLVHILSGWIWGAESRFR